MRNKSTFLAPWDASNDRDEQIIMQPIITEIEDTDEYADLNGSDERPITVNTSYE